MIKVPATPAGLGALEELAAAGVPLNVTLIFSMRQYEAARDAVWRGAQRRKSLDLFKSVYSIFISRVDVYTEKYVPELSPAAQGLVGLVNVKHIWRANQKFWGEHRTPLKQRSCLRHGDEEADRSAVEVRRALWERYPDEPPATNEAVEKAASTGRPSIRCPRRRYRRD
jgi:transaldolase